MFALPTIDRVTEDAALNRMAIAIVTDAGRDAVDAAAFGRTMRSPDGQIT